MEATQGATAPKDTTAPEQHLKRTRTNKELLDFIVESGEGSKAYARQVVEQEIAKDLFDQDWRLARVFAESGVFDEIAKMTPQQAIATAMAKIQLGRNWRLDPADSMQFIYFTNGRPAIMTELFAAKLQEAGYEWDFAHDYEVDPKTRKKKCIGCTIFPKRRNSRGEMEPMTMLRRNDAGTFEQVPLEVSFDLSDAEGAMIWEKGGQKKLSEKWNYQSWSEDMYTWRAIAKFRRRYAPNVLRGAVLPFEAEESGVKERSPEGTQDAAREVLKRKLAEYDQDPTTNDTGSGETGQQVATAMPAEQTGTGHSAGTDVKSPAASAPGLFAGGLGGKRK